MMRTFNCRIVFINEVTLDKLNGQARFSDTTAADDDELILAQELSDRKKRSAI